MNKNGKYQTPVLIKADGTEVPIAPADRTFSLAEMQKAVGGYIQIVHPESTPGYIMVTNGEGKILATPLPRNEKATKIWQDGATHPARLADDVVGDVIFCHKSFVK